MQPDGAETSDAEAWKAEWSDVVDRVGKTDGDGTIRWAIDLVERGAVRRYLEPLEFDCELHCSTEVAQQNGYDDVVAPYTSIFSFSGGPQWSPGEVAFPTADRNAPPQRLAVDPDQYPAAATGIFATDFEVEFMRPVVVGERLGGKGRMITDVSLKQTRVGRGAFIKTESTTVDEAGIAVATLRLGIFVFEPNEPTPAGAAGSTETPQIPEIPVPGDWTDGPPAPDVDGQRTGSDIAVGQLLEPVEFPISVLRLVMAAGANRDFNLIHHNTEAAQATGAPEMYANTLFLQGMWERTVRAFIGNAGVITKVSGFQMVSFNMAGDTATVQGKVQSCEDAGDRTVVELMIWTENSHGLSVGPGTVTVSVPR